MPDNTDELTAMAQEGGLTAMAQEDGMYDVDETTPFRCYPDAEPEIKPRVDDDGVGYCCWDCPCGITSQNPLASITCCAVDGGVDMTEGDVCPVAARRMALGLDRLRVEVEAWRSGRLLFHQGRHDYELVVNVGLTHDPKMTIHRFATINDAVDALMAEREEVTP